MTGIYRVSIWLFGYSISRGLYFCVWYFSGIFRVFPYFHDFPSHLSISSLFNFLSDSLNSLHPSIRSIWTWSHIQHKPREKKERNDFSTATLSIQAPPVNLETTTGVQLSSRFPSISLHSQVCYTRLGNLHEEGGPHGLFTFLPFPISSFLFPLSVPPFGPFFTFATSDSLRWHANTWEPRAVSPKDLQAVPVGLSTRCLR